MRIKLGAVGFLVLAFFVGFGAQSTHAQTTDIQALLQQIQALQQKLQDLQSEEAQVRTELHNTIQLTRTLALGSSGEDVSELQRLLASDPTIYPEARVTGYYGPLTAAAVRKLQEKFGIDQVGVVGPVTQVTVNELFKNRGKGSLNSGRGNVFDRVLVTTTGTSTPGTSTNVVLCHIPPGNASAMHTIQVGAPAVQAHLAHGDTLGACDDDDDDSDDDSNDDSDDEDEDDDNSNSDKRNAEDAIDDATEAIEDAQNKIDNANGDGEDTDEAEELLDDAESKLDEANEAFDDKDYDEAEDLADEGTMTKRRAQAVCEEALVKYANKLGLRDHILLGKGELIKGANDAMVADAFEALFGAVYLDLGFKTAFEMFKKIIVPHLNLVWNIKDFKSTLQEYIQSGDKRNISYHIIKEVGPSHDKEFEAAVRLDNVITLGVGRGKTKKEAEQNAAHDALKKGNYDLKETL